MIKPTEASRTRLVAEAIAGENIAPPNDSVLDKIRTSIADTIACAVHGSTLPWTSLVLAWAEQVEAASHAPSATAWATGTASLRPADAAFVNGVAAHAFDFDDYHNAKLHPGAVVVPAAFAVSEAHGGSGKELLHAVTIGYEVMIRASLALDPIEARRRGWHLTAVCGSLGAAAAAANIMGLDAQQTASALGLAATQSSGLFAFTADGSMSKRFHAGRASAAGVMAAELASMGFTGPSLVLDDIDGGWHQAFSGAPRQEYWADWGARWHAGDVNVKPYSCCGSVHGSIDAALNLRQHYDEQSREASVRVGISQLVDLQCGYAYEPSTVLNAQMSIRYCVAVALLEGAVLPEQFSQDHLARPDIVRLAQKLELVHDPELDALYPEHFSGWIEVVAADNEKKRSFVQDPQGSSATGVQDAVLKAKWMSLLTTRFPESKARDVLQRVAALKETSLQPLISTLTV